MSNVPPVPTLTVGRIREGLRKKEFSAVDVATAALEFAERENPKTNAYLTFSSERALNTANRVDRQIAKGDMDRSAGLVGAFDH